MATFKVNADLLKTLCKVNQFELPHDGMLFFGVRGAITGLPNDQSFKKDQLLQLIDLNYLNPRCTIFQWKLAQEELAAFPASTVPNSAAIKASLPRNGLGSNSLLSGFYSDYRKGWHKPGGITGHPAFRQTEAHPIRRTMDDLDFDNDDRIEYENPHDNIHCGWFQSLDATSYASAGCQVIMGYPKCGRDGRTKNIGPWATFHDNAYVTNTQDRFPYLLVNGLEISQLAMGNAPSNYKLRYGSKGPLVEKLQEKLKKLNYYEGNLDPNFGPRTLKAVLAFQKKSFGAEGVDGIVGALTGAQLGLNLKI
jgi:hypothetical protein